MKVINLHLTGSYTEGYSYHENLLTKYHRSLGHETYLITTPMTIDKDGNRVPIENMESYTNDNGVRIIRLPYLFRNKIAKKLKWYKNLYKTLCDIKPDIIYMHNCQSLDSRTVAKYLKKHPNVVAYADNHSDFSNSARGWFSKNVLHKILWRYIATKVEPYITKFYGVLPARVDFLKDLYKLPAEKCELLVMGADDQLVEANMKPEIKAETREKYGIAPDDFLLVFGGKIDLFKQQILLLIDAVNEIENPKLKLIVFGPVVNEMREALESRVSDKVQYIGWVKSEDSYPLFAACDLAVFPGRHSVFWEQVAGQGIPLLVKHWQGTTHIDVGGNVKFLYDDSKDEIKSAILEIMDNPQLYAEMKQIAMEKGMKEFSYLDIARRSIEEV